MTTGLAARLRLPAFWRRASGARVQGRLLAVAALCAFAIEAARLAPSHLWAAALGFERSGVSYVEASGTIWRGEFHGVAAQGKRLGDLTFRVAPLSLLTTQPAAFLSLSGGAVEGSVRASLAGARVMLSASQVEVDLGAIGRFALLGVPLDGELVLKDLSLAVSRKGCLRAAGAVSTDLAAAVVQRWGGRPAPLQGGLSCNDGRLAVALDGGDSTTPIRVTASIGADRSYQIEASIAGADASLTAALRALGFAQDGEEFVLAEFGALR